MVDAVLGGELRTFPAKECCFSYKHTRFMEEECAAVMREFFQKIRGVDAKAPVPSEKKEID